MTATLNNEEVNALMSAIQTGRVDPGPGRGAKAPVLPYDLISRDRIIRGQMPTLDAINEHTASLLGTGLAGRIRLKVRVTSVPATLLKIADLGPIIAPPATVGVLSLGQGYGLALAVLEPGLADALLAVALGDRKRRPDSAPPEPRRDLTAVERLVLKRLLSILTEAMTSAWTSVLPFKPEVLRFESDPRMATVAPPTETAILSTFEFSDALVGRLQLAIPFAAVESEKKALSSAPKVNTTVDSRFARALAEELEQVEVDVRAVLGETKLSLSRLLELEVGDVLTLDRDERASLDVRVERRLKLTGTPAVNNSSLALVVDQALGQVRSGLERQHQRNAPIPLLPLSARPV